MKTFKFEFVKLSLIWRCTNGPQPNQFLSLHQTILWEWMGWLRVNWNWRALRHQANEWEREEKTKFILFLMSERFHFARQQRYLFGVWLFGFFFVDYGPAQRPMLRKKEDEQPTQPNQWSWKSGESRQREEHNKRERERRAVELSLGGLWACRSSPRKHPTNQLHLHSVNLLGFLGCLLRKAKTSPRCPQMKKEREPNPHSFFSLRMAS